MSARSATESTRQASTTMRPVGMLWDRHVWRNPGGSYELTTTHKAKLARVEAAAS
jgi:hypothetical protein